MASGESVELGECTEELARAFLIWLSSSPAAQQYDICTRALQAFEDEQDSEQVGVLFLEIGRHLRANPDIPMDQRIPLAQQAVERALRILETKGQAEFRAKALANLGIIYLERSRQDRQDKSRALSCFEAALKILQKLQPTPERNEVIGQIHIYGSCPVLVIQGR